MEWWRGTAAEWEEGDDNEELGYGINKEIPKSISQDKQGHSRKDNDQLDRKYKTIFQSHISDFGGYIMKEKTAKTYKKTKLTNAAAQTEPKDSGWKLEPNSKSASVTCRRRTHVKCAELKTRYSGRNHNLNVKKIKWRNLGVNTTSGPALVWRGMDLSCIEMKS